MPQTVTGIAASSIVAVTTSPSTGDKLNTTAQKASVQAIVNDLATIKSGSHTFAGDKTFSGALTFSDNVTLAQTKSITAAGSGCSLIGTWSIHGYAIFQDAETALATGSTLETLSGTGAQSAYAFVDLAAVTAGDRCVVDIAIDVGATVVGGVFGKIVAIEDYGGAGTVRTMSGAIQKFDSTVARARLALVGRHTVVTSGPIRFCLVMDGGVGDSLDNLGTGGVRAVARHTY